MLSRGNQFILINNKLCPKTIPTYPVIIEVSIWDSGKALAQLGKGAENVCPHSRLLKNWQGAGVGQGLGGGGSARNIKNSFVVLEN